MPKFLPLSLGQLEALFWPIKEGISREKKIDVDTLDVSDMIVLCGAQMLSRGPLK